METAIAFGVIVVVVVFAVVYAVELGRARGVGRMFEERRTREPDKTGASQTPSKGKTSPGGSHEPPRAE